MIFKFQLFCKERKLNGSVIALASFHFHTSLKICMHVSVCSYSAAMLNITHLSGEKGTARTSHSPFATSLFRCWWRKVPLTNQAVGKLLSLYCCSNGMEISINNTQFMCYWCIAYTVKKLSCHKFFWDNEALKTLRKYLLMSLFTFRVIGKQMSNIEYVTHAREQLSPNIRRIIDIVMTFKCSAVKSWYFCGWIRNWNANGAHRYSTMEVNTFL